MSVATDTARVGSLVGSPNKKRLTTAATILAMAAVVVAAALVAPNVGGGTPALEGIDPQVRNYHGVVGSAGAAEAAAREAWIQRYQPLGEYVAGQSGVPAWRQSGQTLSEATVLSGTAVASGINPANRLPEWTDILPIQQRPVIITGNGAVPVPGMFLPEPYATYTGNPTNDVWHGTTAPFAERPGQPR